MKVSDKGSSFRIDDVIRRVTCTTCFLRTLCLCCTMNTIYPTPFFRPTNPIIIDVISILWTREVTDKHHYYMSLNLRGVKFIYFRLFNRDYYIKFLFKI